MSAQLNKIKSFLNIDCDLIQRMSTTMMSYHFKLYVTYVPNLYLMLISLRSLAACYIAHLRHLLDTDEDTEDDIKTEPDEPRSEDIRPETTTNQQTTTSSTQRSESDVKTKDSLHPLTLVNIPDDKDMSRNGGGG